jgi:hypothetical protein
MTSYTPKHAKPTSLVAAVLGGRHDSGLPPVQVPRPRPPAEERTGPSAPPSHEKQDQHENHENHGQQDEAVERTAEAQPTRPVSALPADPGQDERDVVPAVFAERAH